MARFLAAVGRLRLTLALALTLTLGFAAQGWPGPWRPVGGDGEPAAFAPADAAGDTLAVLYSGDGGWAALDKGLADDLAQGGMPVIGYNSLRYFATARTPDGAAADLAAALRRQMAAWGKRRIVLVGFSFGADALPAIVPRLPADLRQRIRLVALVGLGPTGDLRFTPHSWLSQPTADAFPTAPAVAALRASLGSGGLVCIYGDREPHPACPVLPVGLARIVALPGGHHFDGDYRRLSRTILEAL
ncbi:AcvB/VirJ family lysyl-phosphatidylglycerol hydrolase [Phenylobacterium sp.]|uniref:AcvB/VirJ family lysyl-phosphatidylglycerol hydrolase n=1 Tax=Phenylobacterium sp. TaxID=1871053 RepID=UPI0025D7F6D3|nr:AcvB/VirJ family lysyl-phosphatidylglycerol hydrolase [Phenylobacterium sp.]